MNTLTVTRGIVASGKTTAARKEQAANRKAGRSDIVTVSKDDLRAMLHNGHWTRDNEQQVIRIQEAIVRDALAHGRDVWIHDTNGNSSHLLRWKAIAAEFGAEYVERDFHLSVEEAIQRDSERANPVGEHVIRRMAHQFKALGLTGPSPSEWQAPYGEMPDRSTYNKLWFTSDLHFNHTRAASWRGFYALDENGEPIPDPSSHDGMLLGDHEAMNNVLKLAMLSKVGPNDLLLVLGDAAMGKRTESLPLYNNLPFRVVLLPGNHDHCGPWNPRQAELFGMYAEHFETILPPIYKMTLKNGQEVTLCHFPRGELDHTDEARYLEYRPPEDGSWLLHGHTHSKYVHQGPRMVHIGVDAWDWGPVSEDEVIAEILSEQEFETREAVA